MYNALTATAKKLATKPEFLDQYRQRFPHIVASTERLLASVEKQPRGGGSAASRGLPQHPGLAVVAGTGGPIAALAAAAATASGAAAAQQQQQHGGAGPSRLGAMGARHMEEEEETTMQLYSQVRCCCCCEATRASGVMEQPAGRQAMAALLPAAVPGTGLAAGGSAEKACMHITPHSPAAYHPQVISSRSYPLAHEEGLAAEEPGAQLQGASLTPIRPGTTASPAGGATPSTEQLLSRAFSITGHAGSSGDSQAPSFGLRSHPISTLANSGGADDTVAPAMACPTSAAVASSIARATAAQLTGSAATVADTAAAAAGAAVCPDRSRPDLQEAIEAALRRSAAPQAAASAPASVPPSYPATSGVPLSAAAARPAAPLDTPALAAAAAQALPLLRPVADQVGAAGDTHVLPVWRVLQVKAALKTACKVPRGCVY